ncbi:MAG: hypothetical protein HY323_11685 [Betaproteobacteria bacterium]|nr:hypothetical protein [Betaproteobacteria bacterium]
MRTLLIFLILIFGLTSSQAAEEKKIYQKAVANSTAKTDQPREIAPPVVINVTGNTQNVKNPCNPTNCNKESENRWWEKLWSDPIATFTFALFLATAALIGTGVIQWRETRNIAKWDLRAYLSGVSQKMQLISNDALRAEVEFRNSGRTTAHNVSLAITGAISPANEKPKFVDPEFIPHKQPIAPNSYWSIGHEFHELTKECIEDIGAKRKLVYIWGRAKYTDIFGKSQRLKFRYRNVVTVLGPDPVTGQRVITSWMFYPEEEGNEAT